MKYPLYSIRDKATSFMQPIPAVNEMAAIRDFSKACSDGLSFQPEDFDLYKVGEFDDQSGEISGCTPIFIVNGLSVRKEK